MTRKIVFKTLIDVLFIGLCFGLLSVILVMPQGLNLIAQENEDVYHWDVFSWVLFSMSASSYICLLIGGKQLRHAAKHKLKTHTYHEKSPLYLKKSGRYLIISSLLSYGIFSIVFLKRIFINEKLAVTFDNNLVFQVLITIVGLFFLIQSDVLVETAALKRENDLTI